MEQEVVRIGMRDSYDWFDLIWLFVHHDQQCSTVFTAAQVTATLLHKSRNEKMRINFSFCFVIVIHIQCLHSFIPKLKSTFRLKPKPTIDNAQVCLLLELNTWAVNHVIGWCTDFSVVIMKWIWKFDAFLTTF